MRWWRAAALSATALALVACTSRPVRAPVPVDTEAARSEDARRAALRDWSLGGRIALSSGGQGGSGRIDWTQHGERYVVSLAAPVTRRSWRLSGDADGARLEGIDGGPRESTDVEGMLRDATGWDIPVRAMADWVRGIGAAGGRGGSPVVAYGPGNRPSNLEQYGWRIDYQEWHEAAGPLPALPRRIEARRGEARVRLVVDAWQAEAPTDPAPVDETGGPAGQLQRVLQGLDLADPAADMRMATASGDLRPVGVCGFACLAPGFARQGAASAGAGLRILDATGDVIAGDAHLRLKAQAEAYARSYNEALSEWLDAHPGASRPASGD